MEQNYTGLMRGLLSILTITLCLDYGIKIASYLTGIFTPALQRGDLISALINLPVAFAALFVLFLGVQSIKQLKQAYTKL